MFNSILALDETILLWIQENLRTPFLTSLMIPITKTGDTGILIIALCIVLLFFKKTRKTGIFVLICVLFNLILNNLVIKNVFQRARPYEVIEELKSLIPPPFGTSFPSGHASFAFSAASAFFVMNKKIAPFAFIYAVIIAFSRIYLGVHYLSDVLAGAVVGILSTYIVVLVWKLTSKKSSKNGYI